MMTIADERGGGRVYHTWKTQILADIVNREIQITSKHFD